MPNLNITNIPAPRVPFVDERTGLMAREWYRFFLNLFVLTGSGNNPISLEELQLGPTNQPDLTELLIQINQNIAPQYADQSGDFLATLDTAQLMSMMSRFENAEAAIQGAYLQPVVQTGTIANYNLDGSPTAGGIVYGTGPALAVSAAGTLGQVLTSGGAGTPTWATDAGGSVTSVAALTLGTTGTDLSSTVANGTTTPVITLQVPTASASNRGALSSTDWSTFNSKGNGTVTSVGFTGGIITVATPTTTPAFTIAGTSGGIPYFSSTSTWATSAALAAGALVLGGGSGVTPATTTTGTGVVTALGVNTGTAGAFVVNGGALGTPSSGTVTNLTGTASININGTVGATTPAAVTATTIAGTDTTDASSTTAAALKTAGGLAVVKKIYVGDNVVQATAAKGFNFTANTPAAGMTSQLLNWYEEGTFTATLTASITAPTTPITVTAYYTVVGRLVTVQVGFFNVDTTGALGSTQITGMPFTAASTFSVGSAAIDFGASSPVSYIISGTTTILLYASNTLAGIPIVASAGRYVVASISYLK